MESLGAFNLIGLTLLGVSLLVATATVYGPLRRDSSDALRRILVCSGWFLIVIGLVGLVVGVSTLLAIPLLVIAAVVAVLAFRLYLRQEHTARMWQIAIAAEAGVPLVNVVAALGRESGTLTGWKCHRQAELLAAGQPLVTVLRDTFDMPARGAALAVGAGADWGDFATPLQEALTAEEEFDFNLRADLSRLVYLYVVSLQILVGLSFLAIKFLPVFQKLLSEFDQPQGPMLNAMVSTSAWFLDFWYLALPLAPLLLLGLMAGLLYIVDLWPSRFPGFSFFTGPLDRGWVLRGLAWGLRAGKPVPEILATLASHYRIARIRAKLDDARAFVQNGVPWIDALAQVRLVRASDAAVLRAAQRAGNLEWALREQAASNSRGWGSLVKRILVVLFPILLAMLGLVVLLAALAVFETLVGLMNALT